MRKKRLISAVTSIALLMSSLGAAVPAASAASYTNPNTKQMEYLTRGLTAVRTDGGVFLSWRLLGTESMTQKFDIYRDGKLIAQGVDALNYTDDEGFSYSVYRVVPEGADMTQCAETAVWQNNYIDIPLNRPDGGTTTSGDQYTYSVNDTSVGDVDGDGEYEYIVKWDPSNSKDNSAHGQTGNVLIDCYEMDGTQLWRIDLGVNIRAGAHYTQFIVYDFDGDGKAEMALRTAPGSKDGANNYVSDAGTDLTWDGYNNESDLRQGGSKSGHIIKGPDWLTMFNGETGEAMKTVDFVPQRGSVRSWGDNYGGRSERFLAGVAYLDGKTPSLIMARGYYEKASVTAWKWDGTDFIQQWNVTDSGDMNPRLYAQGTHSLSIADADNDGFDEIIYGSAVIDHNGSVLNSTRHGHGDALHVSDFDNDGSQEVMMVHEDKAGYREYGAEVREASNANIIARVGASGDVGRGVMANVDDEYAMSHPLSPSLFWSVASDKLYDFNGNVVTRTVTTTDAGNVVTTTEEVLHPSETNFFIYWDGDLGREILDQTRIVKFSVEDGSTRLETFSNVHANNSSKATPALSADLFGDWREEVAFGTNDNTALRIFTTTTPTDYKIPTLMHDSQYRCAVAWQNVGYNQPPHTSYYIGSLALAEGQNYLDPSKGFDTIEYAHEPDSIVETPDIEEDVVFDSESFNNGTAGFNSGTVTGAGVPYNNALQVTDSSELYIGYLFDSTKTPPPATPTPVPTPTPTPAPTPTPEPSPDVVYENNFNDMAADTVLAAVSDAETSEYTGIDGLTLRTGSRDSDGASTNWKIQTGGVGGNALVMNSGKYCNDTRAPRMVITTPELESGQTAVMSIMARLYQSGSVIPQIRYNDNADNIQGTDISQYFNTTDYKELKVTIKRTGDEYTRTIFVDDEQIAADNAASFPVIWGTVADGTANIGTGIYFDNFSVGILTETIEPTPAPTPTQKPTECSEITMGGFTVDENGGSVDITNGAVSADVTADVYAAVYTADGALYGVWKQSVTVPGMSGKVNVKFEGMTIPAGGYAKAFAWNEAQQPYDECEIYSGTAAQTANVDLFNDTDADDSGTYKIEFDWRPGTSVQILNGNRDNIISISKSSGAPVRYVVGAGEETTLNASLTANAWYHAELTVDLTAKTADIAVMDYTNNGDTKTVYAASFAGVEGLPEYMVVNGSSYIDNVTVSKIVYNTPQSLININVADVSGDPVADATVLIGSKSLMTDSTGHAAVKMNSGEYSYTITKAAYKSASGTVDASAGDTAITATLNDGEERSIYVSQIFNGEISLAEPVLAGTQKENTVYTVPDSAKGDVTYTFPEWADQDEPYELIGYEDYAGQTYTFEYDPDNSSTVDVRVEEGADTYINLAYKMKRVPTASDTEVLKVLMSQDGVGRDSWTANTAEYMQDEETGVKYTNFSNIGANPVTINIPNESAQIVFEYDIMYKNLDFGGNYFGMTPYNGNTAGQGFGMRTSRAENNQWQWCYRSGGDNYLSYISEINGNKQYTYAFNWQNQWAHVIVTCDGAELKVTAMNKSTGQIYLQDAVVPLANSVGTESKPINKVVFGRQSGSGEGTIGIANFKAYTVGSPEGTYEELTVDLKPQSEISFASGTHISDVEGIEYDVSSMVGASYELQDASGAVVSPEGITLSEDGILTTTLESFDGVPQYYVVIKYNGTAAKKYELNYLTKTLETGTYKGFDNPASDGISPFENITASGFSITNNNGVVEFNREAGTGTNQNMFITLPIWRDTLHDEFIFKFDMNIEKAYSKGYFYLQDGSGNNMISAESHIYQPRLKFYENPDRTGTEYTFRQSDWTHNAWYTFEFVGTGMSSDADSQITLNVYKKGETTPIWSHTFTSVGANKTGLTLKWQAAQGTPSDTTTYQDNGDIYLFDEIFYQYYDYS